MYTLKLVFGICTNHSLGFQSATAAGYTVWMYHSDGQPTVSDSDLLVYRGYSTEDADPQSETDEEVDTMHRGRPLGAGQLTRVRHLSPVDLRDSSSRVNYFESRNLRVRLPTGCPSRMLRVTK
jgi:hypothetical protein